MAQTAVFVIIESELYIVTTPVIETAVPDESDIISYALDEELTGNITASYAWYEIGDGESGTDEFFTKEELLKLYSDGSDFIQNCGKTGYDVEMIENGKIHVTVLNEE